MKTNFHAVASPQSVRNFIGFRVSLSEIYILTVFSTAFVSSIILKYTAILTHLSAAPETGWFSSCLFVLFDHFPTHDYFEYHLKSITNPTCYVPSVLTSMRR